MSPCHFIGSAENVKNCASTSCYWKDLFKAQSLWTINDHWAFPLTIGIRGIDTLIASAFHFPCSARAVSDILVMICNPVSVGSVVTVAGNFLCWKCVLSSDCFFCPSPTRQLLSFIPTCLIALAQTRTRLTTTTPLALHTPQILNMCPQRKLPATVTMPQTLTGLQIITRMSLTAPALPGKWKALAISASIPRIPMVNGKAQWSLIAQSDCALNKSFQ